MLRYYMGKKQFSIMRGLPVILWVIAILSIGAATTARAQDQDLPGRGLLSDPVDSTDEDAAFSLETETGIAEATAMPPPAAADSGSGNYLNDPLFNALHPDIQDEIIAEAESIYNDCSRKLTYSYYHDCGCLAGRFVEERLKQGPDQHTYSLRSTISRDCANQPGIAGHSFNLCMNSLGLLSPSSRNLREPELEEHCTCFARTMATRYARAPNPHYKYIARLRTQSMQACADQRNQPVRR